VEAKQDITEFVDVHRFIDYSPQIVSIPYDPITYVTDSPLSVAKFDLGSSLCEKFYF